MTDNPTTPEAQGQLERCLRCLDDGWIIEQLDGDDRVTGVAMCPRLNEPGHAPFNATGRLPGGQPTERNA